MKELNPEQLEKLKKHVYSCSNCSLLDPFMQNWWCWLVKQFPLNIAPNLITIVGLLINIITALVLVYYSPYADQEVPNWACFLCLLGLFIYQSLDAIDGKQARRTNTSSPLGELFDHGCDSISTVFVSISVCCAVQLGTQPYWLFCQCMMAVGLFYCAHWQTYVSGKLRFGLIDVTEAQFGVMTILLISTIFGSNFWSTRLPFLDLTARSIYIMVGLTNFSLAMMTYIPAILTQGGGKNGSSVAGTSVLSPVVPLLLFVVPALMVAWKSTNNNIFISNPLLYMFTFGFVAARVTNRLVVAHMTKHEMAYTDRSLLGPGALLLNQFLDYIIPEYWLLWAVFMYVVYDLLTYCSRVCLEICDSMKIELFRIPPGGYTHLNNTSTTNPKTSSSKYETRSKAKGRHN